MWKTRTLGKGMSKWKCTDAEERQSQGHGLKVQVKVQEEAKGKGKKRSLETCVFCGKEGHMKEDCKFKTATCSNCGKVGHLRVVTQNASTSEIEKHADQPSPEVNVEGVWFMAVQDAVHDVHCVCTEKHDVMS